MVTNCGFVIFPSAWAQSTIPVRGKGLEIQSAST